MTRQSEIERRLDTLFGQIGRLTDTELVLLRTIWEELDATAREDAWQQVKAAIRGRRREALLDDARSQLVGMLMSEVPPVGIAGVATFPSNPSGLSRSSVRAAAMPPLLDGVAAIIAADGLDAAQQTLLLEPVSRLARHDPPSGSPRQ
jgi:hypothetical protein